MSPSPTPADDMDGLETRLVEVRAGVHDAAHAAGRDPSAITTIVVTKFHSAQLVRRLVELGVHDFGESRHQEAQPKIQELADLDLTWHFVGQLQRKKAKVVASYSDVIHSVDREPLVTALESDTRTVDVFIQVNLTSDPDRGGVQPTELEPLATRVLAAEGINLLGVMAVAPLGEEPRRAFARLRAASERLRALSAASDAISAGMSQDYPQAIAEGATHLRIGSAITGNRPTGR